MSEYFTRKNTKEFGPAPNGDIEWMIVQSPFYSTDITECAIVKAKTAYLALEIASTLINNLDKQACKCYPNPKLIFQGDKK